LPPETPNRLVSVIIPMPNGLPVFLPVRALSRLFRRPFLRLLGAAHTAGRVDHAVLADPRAKTAQATGRHLISLGCQFESYELHHAVLHHSGFLAPSE
jgi:hypothetical protein